MFAKFGSPCFLESGYRLEFSNTVLEKKFAQRGINLKLSIENLVKVKVKVTLKQMVVQSLSRGIVLLFL
jgi:hypothetical protein